MPSRRASARLSRDSLSATGDATDARDGKVSSKHAHSSPESERQSKRQKTKTDDKSPYFKRQASADDSPDDLSASEVQSDGSDFGSVENEESAVSESSDEDSIISDQEPKRRRSKVSSKKSASAAHTASTHGKELWREDATLNVAEGTEVVIKRPKPRGPGKTPYRDHTIHPNTLLFLQDLKANNDRTWLKMHDPDYRTSLADFDSFLTQATEKLVIDIDPTIPDLPTKDIIFRIYRDVRFSPDQTPYKTHFSAAWSRTGRKGPYAAYYLQVTPRESFIGGGCWHPDAQPLVAMRRSIDRHPDRLRTVLMEPQMRKEFLANASKKDADVINAFISSRSNAESALKTKPKGFDADHKDILLLRLRSFTIGRKLTDEEVLGPHFLERVAELFRIMCPFITFLNSVVMPDETVESSDESVTDTNGSEEAS